MVPIEKNMAIWTIPTSATCFKKKHPTLHSPSFLISHNPFITRWSPKTTGQTFLGSYWWKLVMVFKMFLQETPAEPVAVGSEVLVLLYPPAVKDGWDWQTRSGPEERVGMIFCWRVDSLMSIEYVLCIITKVNVEHYLCHILIAVILVCISM